MASRNKSLYDHMKYFNRTEFKVLFELVHGNFTVEEITEDTGITAPRVRDAIKSLKYLGVVFEDASHVFALQPDVSMWNTEGLKSRKLYETQNTGTRVMA